MGADTVEGRAAFSPCHPDRGERFARETFLESKRLLRAESKCAARVGARDDKNHRNLGRLARWPYVPYACGERFGDLGPDLFKPQSCIA